MGTYGTQAHSWVMAHEDEAEAFRHFLDAFPDHAVLLLDTYDVRAALGKIIKMGRKPSGVRLDSGDLVKDSRWVRRELDRAGWRDVKIFASGDLDEDQMTRLLKAGAQIDAFGVGTALATPGDAPHLNLVYKLVEIERDGNVRGAAKLTYAKVTYPGRKQVFRSADRAGNFSGDQIALSEENVPGAEPLLIEAMRGGRRVVNPETTLQARERCAAGLRRLPEKYRQLKRDAAYPVRYSARLEALLDSLKKRVRRGKSK
jgi:nicotinate phosphoribosyltransferase